MVRPIVAALVSAALWQAVPPPLERFVEASSADERIAKPELDRISAGWKRNRAEVLVMRLGRETAQSPRVPVAIDTQFLRKHPVYTFSAAGERFVVITSKAGANRVYQVDTPFPEQREGTVVRDANGAAWRVTESGLVVERDPKTRLSRLPAQRAFWFGWYAQFPDTMLIK